MLLTVNKLSETLIKIINVILMKHIDANFYRYILHILIYYLDYNFKYSTKSSQCS